MRYFFVISVFLGLLLQNFSQVVIMVKYKIDQAYIARVLCENRDKPDMHCNGKCYFIKKIKQAQENERSSERQSQRNLFQEAFITKADPIKFQSQLLYTINTPYTSGDLAQFNGTLFRPPRLI